MRVALRKRPPGGGGTPTFLSTTSALTPAGGGPRTPSDAYAAGWTLVPFNVKAGLTTALGSIAANQYIYYSGPGTVPTGTDFAAGTFYSGSGSLSISTSTATAALSISGKNIAGGRAIIDFGCSHNYWDATKIIPNYVAFSSTYTSQSSCLVVSNCSNLTIYGGDISCDYGYGIEIDGPIDNLTMWDQYIHHVGSSGLWVRDYLNATATHVKNSDFRMEVNRFCMNPAIDSHADKGTGHHAFILHGNTGETSGNRFICYGHDPLLPGETAKNGVVQPEGSGGACIEAGHDGTGSYANNTYYALGVNLLMTPNGTNPGSTSSQTGGNVIECYGKGVMTGNVFGWIEGQNCTGAVFHGNPGDTTWAGAAGTIVVNHGRHSNVNQYTGGSNGSPNNVPYGTGFGITYNDCT